MAPPKVESSAITTAAAVRNIGLALSPFPIFMPYFAICTSPTGVAGRAVLDDEVDVGHVDTASRDVGSHQNLELLLAELVDGDVALVLGDVSVQHLQKDTQKKR